MSVTSDYMNHTAAATPVPLALRVIALVIGAALVLAAAGLWLVPGSSFSAELMLIKGGLTAFFALGGLGFLHAGLQRAPRD